MKVKSVLVSQPKPETDKSPYLELAKKYNLKLDFRPFIHVEPVSSKDFRQTRVHIPDYTAVIMTSRNAVDHFFRICGEMRIGVPENMKYFCVSESTAYYLQKYVIYRKRKIFHGKQKFADLIEIIKKHRGEKFLLPCSDVHKEEAGEYLEKEKIRYTKAVLYRTVASDLSDLANVNYDMLVFFSPSGIKSLFKNFPKFKQNNTLIAAFGPTTARAAIDAGLKLDIHAPTPQAPSMTMALERYIQFGEKADVESILRKEEPVATPEPKPKPQKAKEKAEEKMPAKQAPVKAAKSPKKPALPTKRKPAPLKKKVPATKAKPAPVKKKKLVPAKKKVSAAAKKGHVAAKKKIATAKRKPLPAKRKPAPANKKTAAAKKKKR